uniref:Uncharacterized protein n=1 Tax=Meloidogyne incognita TaxID=6306 RepID=A0A914MNZ6_MELIC
MENEYGDVSEFLEFNNEYNLEVPVDPVNFSEEYNKTAETSTAETPTTNSQIEATTEKPTTPTTFTGLNQQNSNKLKKNDLNTEKIIEFDDSKISIKIMELETGIGNWNWKLDSKAPHLILRNLWKLLSHMQKKQKNILSAAEKMAKDPEWEDYSSDALRHSYYKAVKLEKNEN